MPFKEATYNVLATAYIRRDYYPGVPAELLEPAWRVPALVRHVASLDADLLCLQEVEPSVFAALREGLGPFGYTGHLETKARNKPDDCATFYRTTVFTPRAVQRLEYHDQERGLERHSGFVALLLVLAHAGRLLGVANTHLRWDEPGKPRQEQVGYRQAVELMAACRRCDTPGDGWLICGDFNRLPEGEVVTALRQAGYEFAHAGRPHVRTCVANGRARLIDYLFHCGALRSRPLDPPPIVDDTRLPSGEQPSDHLALLAELDWTVRRRT